MNDDVFARLVAEEVKNKISEEHRQYLMLPENWTRWQRALRALSLNLERQLAQIHESEQEAISKYDGLGEEGAKLIAELSIGFADRRKKIERFAYYVELRYDTVTRMILLGIEKVEERMGIVAFYRNAITRHKELIEEYELDQTPMDTALWATLDGKWEFDQIDKDALVEYLDED